MIQKFLSQTFLLVFSFFFISLHSQSPKNTIVAIESGQFYINGELTYKERYWDGHPVEGLLMNSRMVQGIFDDLNPSTVENFSYPDTQKWDADRNTDEFVAAMEVWKEYGLLAFSLNLQGGSPLGYSNNGCINSAFDAMGNLRPAYINRLTRILDRADALGMVVILGYFYFGQDQYLEDEKAILNATDNITRWILEKGYQNIVIEINNECNGPYDHEVLTCSRVHELVQRVKQMGGENLLVSTSYGGGVIPQQNVLQVSDFILIHGNGVDEPSGITDMVEKTKKVAGYTGQPILFNEDDHFDFDADDYNFKAAIESYASWRYFDYRMKGEGFEHGFQSIPVDWGINSIRKKAFFKKLKEITGY
ncbi:hypothetical protein LCL86_01330 [Muricauda ruestringensis]|uniref:hypothetical protein n=1 Tax=Flagellimonas ruestringensis TaxID=111501 RepID=UPI001CD5B8AD|nr:hypothetical protein [Allomuricauda ruestringensis]MCA0957667.1 hypothetical protein [Allomuricauda ruestringensis]